MRSKRSEPLVGHGYCLTALQAFDVMVRFLGEYGPLMADRAGAIALANDLQYSALDDAGVPITKNPQTWHRWLDAIEAALAQPEATRSANDDDPSFSSRGDGGAEGLRPRNYCLSALQSFDAMIRFLEQYKKQMPVPDGSLPEPEYGSAVDGLLSELSYGEVFDDELGTADPRTWHDWLNHIPGEI